MKTAEQERADIVAFLEMIAEEVPPESVEALDRLSGSEAARKSVEVAAAHIKAGVHDKWLAMRDDIATRR